MFNLVIEVTSDRQIKVWERNGNADDTPAERAGGLTLAAPTLTKIASGIIHRHSKS